MIARYASAITTGTLMTFALLYAMQGLIQLQPGAQSVVPLPIGVNWINLHKIETPVRPEDPVVDKESLTKESIPPTGRPTSGEGPGFAIPVGSRSPGPVNTKLEKLGQPDGPLISIVRVQPAYPAVAQARGLEGWVDVRFDVMTDGQVVNIDVISSSNRLFESAAIKAAQRFRFRAPVVNGIPEVATGIEYRFRFEMNER